MKDLIKKLILVLVSLIIVGCSPIKEEYNDNNLPRNSDYGVFLSLEGKKLIDKSQAYKTVVADAQYLLKNEIELMHKLDKKVYTYLNIGSLEDFRPYYKEYDGLILKPYHNWEEEYWVDVTNEEWQNFIIHVLAKQMLEKDIDGFWIDNVDVYGQFPEEEIYKGVENILKGLMGYNKEVIINGGDEFVELYLKKNGHLDDVLTGVNQETVFSSINFKNKTFKKQTEEEQSYYLDYLNTIDKLDKDIFLLEYTKDRKLIKEIKNYTGKKGWKYYISNSIELKGN